MERREIEKIRNTQRLVWEAMQPYVRMKMEILNVAMPKILMREGELPEHIYSDEVNEQLRQIDGYAKEAMERIMKASGIAIP